MENRKKRNVKKILVYVLAAIPALALYAAIVHFVLVLANVSKPAPTTVYGLTIRRKLALVFLLLALVSVIMGGRTLLQFPNRISLFKAKKRAALIIISGLLAAIAGALNLFFAVGGPGTGNGVLGSAQALVLGLAGTVLGVLILRKKEISINKV